jgi:hypothetical protein
VKIKGESGEEITDDTSEQGFSSGLAVSRVIALIDEEVFLSHDGVIEFDESGTGSITVCVSSRAGHMVGRERGELALGFVESRIFIEQGGGDQRNDYQHADRHVFKSDQGIKNKLRKKQRGDQRNRQLTRDSQR